MNIKGITRLYKFLPADLALQDLSNRQIKISTFPDMNDPFELLGGLDCDQQLREHRAALVTRLNDWCGVLCFSRDWHNAMLWSHYGDKHKGICLGLDISKEVELAEPLYVANREEFDADLRVLLAAAPRVKSLQPSDKDFQACEEVMGRVLLTKFDAWRYENEVRIFIALKQEQKQDALYFAEFDEQIKPSMIILGPRCSTSVEEVDAAISEYSPPITVVRTMLSPNSFAVVDQASDATGRP